MTWARANALIYAGTATLAAFAHAPAGMVVGWFLLAMVFAFVAGRETADSLTDTRESRTVRRPTVAPPPPDAP